MKKTKKILVSGGFDPVHPGHIALFEEAAKLGELHIVLNSDDWLVRKKGFFFQPWPDRKKILEAYTPHIHAVADEDGTVCEALRRLRPDCFGNGGDRIEENTPETDVCGQLGVEMIFGLGGEKYASSSEVNAKKHVKTRWGSYDVLLDMPKLKVKLLNILPNHQLSLQKHAKRSEFFFMPNGEVRMNLPGVWHTLLAPQDRGLTILEVQVGSSAEDDITKISEKAKLFPTELNKKIKLNKN